MMYLFKTKNVPFRHVLDLFTERKEICLLLLLILYITLHTLQYRVLHDDSKNRIGNKH